ncbi:MAG: hypothetical protein ABI273_14375, partial [Lacunisphaera sp.]
MAPIDTDLSQFEMVVDRSFYPKEAKDAENRMKSQPVLGGLCALGVKCRGLARQIESRLLRLQIFKEIKLTFEF